MKHKQKLEKSSLHLILMSQAAAMMLCYYRHLAHLSPFPFPHSSTSVPSSPSPWPYINHSPVLPDNVKIPCKATHPFLIPHSQLRESLTTRRRRMLRRNSRQIRFRLALTTLLDASLAYRLIHGLWWALEMLVTYFFARFQREV